MASSASSSSEVSAESAVRSIKAELGGGEELASFLRITIDGFGGASVLEPHMGAEELDGLHGTSTILP